MRAPSHKHVDDGCTQNAGNFNAWMVIEVGVFSAEDGILDVCRDFAQMHKVAALFTEFADELSIGAPDAKGHFGTVVRKRVKRRKLTIDESEDEDGEKYARGQPGSADAGKPFEKCADSGAALCGGACGFFGFCRHRCSGDEKKKNCCGFETARQSGRKNAPQCASACGEARFKRPLYEGGLCGMRLLQGFLCNSSFECSEQRAKRLT